MDEIKRVLSGEMAQFVVEFRDVNTNLPVDLDNVQITILHYDGVLEVVDFGPEYMVHVDTGTYYYQLLMPHDLSFDFEYTVKYTGYNVSELRNEEVFESLIIKDAAFFTKNLVASPLV